jgi:hypothetical protein
MKFKKKCHNVSRCFLLLFHEISTQFLRKFIENEQVISREDEEIFTKAKGAKIRVLHKQKLFTHTLPLLLSNYNSSQGSSRQSTVAALSHLIRNTPHAIVVQHITSILPVLLDSISVDGEAQMNATLSLFSELLRLAEARTHMENHLESLIGKFLEVSKKNYYMVSDDVINRNFVLRK